MKSVHASALACSPAHGDYFFFQRKKVKKEILVTLMVLHCEAEEARRHLMFVFYFEKHLLLSRVVRSHTVAPTGRSWSPSYYGKGDISWVYTGC